MTLTFECYYEICTHFQFPAIKTTPYITAVAAEALKAAAFDVLQTQNNYASHFFREGPLNPTQWKNPIS